MKFLSAQFSWIYFDIYEIFWKQFYPFKEILIWPNIACIASVSARVRQESSDESKKKKEWGGRGKGAKETLARKPHDFEKLRSPTNAAFDWWGAGSTD